MFIVRHRCSGEYLADTRGICAVWRGNLAQAYRFQSVEDAWTTAYVACITTSPEDLQVVQIADLERSLQVSA